jgi:nucleotide-binding universal stress UspA family protein
MNNQISPRHLLLAVDGSEHANAATHLVQDLPLPQDCQISIISVIIPRNVQQHVILSQVLEQTKVLLQHSHPNQIQTHLLTGYPAEQIVAFAEENQPELIVMGARGLRSTLGILLGGVAQNVVEYAGCPVLVVRAPYEGLRRVLFATDGSDNSQYAMQYLQNCPLPADVSKYVIHVLPPEITAETFSISWQISPGMDPPILTEQMQEQILQNAKEEEKMGKSLLEETSAQLESLGFTATSVLRRGDAATEIIDYVREEKIDLIIVGSRGLSTFRSWLLGSVSRKLVHYADCSVLIVKKPQKQTRR